MKEIIYVFIDSQNLNLGTSKDIYKNKILVYRGWKLDFKKFFKYLINKFKANKVFLFIGYIKRNKNLYRFLKSCGYDLVFKPTVKDNQGKPKGNVDTEIVLHSAAIEYHNYTKAIFVAGDGDYYCLYEYLLNQNKLYKIVIPNKNSESSLLKKFQSFKIFLYREKKKLEYEPNKKGRRRS